MFTENLKIALRAILANKMRSILTVLGVMIGVAAVIAVVSIVQGLQHKISNDLADIGTTFIEVFPDPGEQRNPFLQKLPDLTIEDAAAVRRGTTSIRDFTPIFINQAQTKHGEARHAVQLYAVGPSYQEIVNHWVERGRFFTPVDEEQRKRVCTIGIDAAKDLNLGDDPIGKLVPPQGNGVRWDGGYDSGDEVSQYYDNLIGKLIVWAGDRDAAIGRMLRCLDEFVLEGVATTIPAAEKILDHPDFRNGEHSTKWVEDTLDLTGVTGNPTPAADDVVEKVERSVDVEVNGKRFAVKLFVPADQVAVAGSGGGGGSLPKARKRTKGGGGAAPAAGSGKIAVPMQGTIVKVNVAVGDEVTEGQVLCVLEAMKMENNIAADKAGTIAEVKVEEGASVGAGDIIIVID